MWPLLTITIILAIYCIVQPLCASLIITSTWKYIVQTNYNQYNVFYHTMNNQCLLWQTYTQCLLFWDYYSIECKYLCHFVKPHRISKVLVPVWTFLHVFFVVDQVRRFCFVSIVHVVTTRLSHHSYYYQKAIYIFCICSYCYCMSSVNATKAEITTVLKKTKPINECWIFKCPFLHNLCFQCKCNREKLQFNSNVL